MEGGKQRDEERRKAGKGKEGKKESHEGFDTQVRNISRYGATGAKLNNCYITQTGLDSRWPKAL